MTDKLALLKMAYDSLCVEKEFMAYYLNEYLKLANKKEQQLLDELKCSKESMYKLALCKSPTLEQTGGFQQLLTLSEYTDVDIFQIKKIINFVKNVQALQLSQQTPLLLAARDKPRTK